MKKRGVGENSPVIGFIGGVYKESRKCGEFVTRFLGTRDESSGIVVYEKGIVKGAIT